MNESKTTANKPPKKVLNALERVFASEIEGHYMIQSKASIYRDLLAAGLVWLQLRAHTAPDGAPSRCLGMN